MYVLSLKLAFEMLEASLNWFDLGSICIFVSRSQSTVVGALKCACFCLLYFSCHSNKALIFSFNSEHKWAGNTATAGG